MGNNLKERERIIALLDIYENLLTDNQKRMASSYYRCDLSLSEIAEMESISRAAVSDCLAKVVSKLEDSETALGLLALKEDTKEKLDKADKSNNKDEEYRKIIEGVINGI